MCFSELPETMIDKARELFQATRRHDISKATVSVMDREKFDMLAKVAQNSRALKEAPGEYGTTSGVFINSHLMMAGIFNEDGDMECYDIM